MRKKLSEIQPGERFWGEGKQVKYMMIGPHPEGWAVYEEDTADYLDSFARHSKSVEFEIIPPTPEPKYRPFKDAAEFEPHRDRWVKWSWSHKNAVCRVTMYHAHGFWIDGKSNQFLWDDAFKELAFDDGSPFGVLETSDE